MKFSKQFSLNKLSLPFLVAGIVGSVFFRTQAGEKILETDRFYAVSPRLVQFSPRCGRISRNKQIEFFRNVIDGRVSVGCRQFFIERAFFRHFPREAYRLCRAAALCGVKRRHGRQQFVEV